MNNSMNLSRPEKLELATALVEREKRIAADPLSYAEQHQKQKEVTASRAAIRALFWGNRVGKTEWGAQEVATVAQGQHQWIAPGEIWVFSPSFDEGAVRRSPSKAMSRDERKSRAPAKSSSGLMKSRWFDEEPPKDIWDECFVRMEAGVKLFIILTMTPIKGMTWVYNDIYLNTSNPDIFVSEANWDDNPWLTDEQKQQGMRGLSAQSLKVRREGKFMKQVGLVATWFSRTIHVVDIKELPFGDTYFGLDFGFSNPAAGLWIRIDRDFNFWIFDGFYRRGLTNPDIQDLIKLKEQGLGRVTRIADAAQASDIKQLNDEKISITAVEKVSGTKKQNWDEWRASLMEEQGRVQKLTGKPKIFISSQLVDIDDDPMSKTFGTPFNFLVKELENLRWEERKTDLGVEQQAAWGKQPNHAIDVFTYILATIHKPKVDVPMPSPTTNLLKPLPGMAAQLFGNCFDFNSVMFSKEIFDFNSNLHLIRC